MFVLLGRDKHAPTLVRLWALLRHRDGEKSAKVDEALLCADMMDAWARNLGKSPTAADVQHFHDLLTTATIGMESHPEAFVHPCECDACCTDD
jgi:hypothetical protein